MSVMVGDGLSVVVVDDHEVFRRGLVTMLRERGIKVLADAGLAAEGMAQASELRPDVVLMDINMPGMSGIAATQRLSSTLPLTRVLVLTVVDDPRDVTDALLAGACGYVLKDSSVDEIVEGIRAARRGESLISPRIASQLVRRLREPDELAECLSGSELTPRELEVLEMLARGMDNPEIAQALYLSQHTVKNHVSSILLKLQVENRIQAAVRAVRGGLV
jgi:DNA-binding NarL/FixJ family response regulator